MSVSKKALVVAGLSFIGVALYAANPGTVAPTTDRANTTTALVQQAAAVARDADGDYVVVWSGSGTQVGNVDAEGVFFQRYNAKGTPVGGETLVNQTTSGTQGNAAIAMDSVGNFVVVWESSQAETTAGVEPPSGKGIWARRYAAAGTPEDDEFQVNAYTASDQALPAVAMDADGDFVVAWQSLGQDGSGQGIYAQRYGADGVAAGGEFRANFVTANSQRNASVAMQASGAFAIAWESTAQTPDSDQGGIFGQLYAADGTALFPAQDVALNALVTGNQTNPAVGRAQDGAFVVAWTGPDVDGTGIFARRFDANGGPIDAQEFAVNSTTAGNQASASVALDASGDFFVAWQSNPSGSNADIVARRYSAGATAGGEGEITVTGSSDQTAPAAAVDADGDLVVAWQGNGTGDSDGVFSRRIVGPEDVNLSIATTDSPDPAPAGGTLTYAITVSNGHAASGVAGVGHATGVTVTDTLPSGVINPQISATADWTCPTAPTSGAFTCTLNNPLAPAATTGAITVTMTAPLNAPAHTLTNTAAVTGDQFDSVAANNTATSRTSVCGLGESVGTLAVTNTSANEGANGAVTVSRSGGTCGELSVQVGISANTATTPADFSATTPQTLTWADGETGPKSVATPVTTVDDALYETNETVTITLSSPNPSTTTTNGTLTINDGEAAPSLAIADKEQAEGNAGSSTMNFVVTLTPAPGTTVAKDVTVNYSTTNGGATTADSDYAGVTNALLTFNCATTNCTGAANNTRNAAVIVNGDVKDEDTETFTVTLSGQTPAGVTLSDATATGTITDEDNAPTVQFAAPSSTVSETGTGDGTTPRTLDITLSLSAPSSRTITVPVTFAGTAATPNDYTAPTTVTFNPGETSKPLTITVAVDALDEDNETVVPTLGTPTNATLGAQVSHTASILDDDALPVVAFGAATSSVTGDTGQTHNITISLNPVSGREVKVNYALGAGTATLTTDYSVSPSPGTITIPAGTTSTTLVVTVANDTLDEDNETVAFTLNTPVNATVGSQAAHTFTINDEDPLPALTFDASASSGSENSGSKVVTLTLSAPSGRAVTAPFTVNAAPSQANDATSGTDFSVPTSSPITIAAGATTASITVNFVNDGSNEADENVRLALGTLVNATAGARPAHVVTITNDDALPQVAFASATSSASEGAGTKTILVQLSRAAEQDVQLSYALTGTAANGTDYTLSPASPLVIAEGESSKVLTVALTNDAFVETDETVIVTLSNPINATLNAPTQHTLTVTNDDEAGFTIAQSGDTTRVVEGATNGTQTDSYTIVLKSRPTMDVTVEPTSTSQVTVTSSLTFTTDNWNVPQTVTVTANDDATPEGEHAAAVTHTVTSGDANYGGFALGSVNVAIQDDDVAGVLIQQTDGGTTVTENGATDTYSVRLSAQPSAQVDVTLTPDAQVTLSTSTLAFDSTDWDTPKVVTVTAFNDAVDESTAANGAHAGGIAHSTTSGDAAFDGLGASLAVQVLDDDTAGVTLSKTSATATEGGAGDTYTIRLDSQPVDDVTVTIVPDGQVSVNPTQVVFNAVNWNLAVAIDVTAADDALDEVSPHAGTITHSVGVADATGDAAYSGLAVGNVSVAVADDDDPVGVTLGLAGSPLAEAGGSATVTATLSAVSGRDVTIDLAYAGTATPTSDYTRSGTSIVIAAGATSGSVTLTGVTDALDEADETVIVDIASVTNGTETGTQQVTATITDDDAEPGVTLSLADSPLAENGGVATVTAALDAVSSKDVTVALGYSGTATNASDYARSGTSITIAAGATTGSATLTGVDDALDEIDETVVVDVTGVTNGLETGTQQVTATITDDDATPTVTLSLAGSPTAENGGVATVTATLSAVSSRDVTVTLLFGGTAGIGSDYSASAASISILAGAATGSITLTASDDALDETDETVTVDIDTATNALEATEQQVTATITDDDATPTVTLSQAGSPFAENGGVATITATLSAASGRDVTVSLAYGGTASSGDYSGAAGSVTITAGATTASVSLLGVNDALDEADETVVVDISGVTNGTESGTQQVTATIADDDAAPAVTLSLAGSPLAENGGVATVTATLDEVSGRDVTVNLAFTGTATGAADYTSSGAAIVISAGAMTGSVTLTGVDDALDEADETILVDITAVTNGTESGAQQVTATIADDDAAPTVTLGITGSPLAENGGVATVTATLSAASGRDVTVSLGFTGTATLTSDYTRSGTSIVIAAGATTGNVTVTGADDALDEPAETVVVDITGVTNGTESGTQQVTATIADDDAAPGVTLSLSGSPAAENGGVATVTATLSAASGQDVTVGLGFAGTATLTSDYTRSGTSIVIAAGATTGSVTLTAADDALDELNETIAVDITAVTNGSETGTQQVVATITDDDAAPTVSLGIAGSPLAENGGAATVTATLSGPSGQDVTVDLGFSGTAGASVDYTASAASIVIAAGATSGTVTVTAADDALDEANETVVVDITTVTNGSESGVQQVTGTIVDDDAGPTVTLGLTGSPLAENGGVATVTATLSSISGQAVTVNLAASGTAGSPADYGLSGTSIVIAAGQTSGSVTITAANDALDEVDETVVVDIATVTNGSEAGTQQVTATITDDDAAPTVTLSVTGTPMAEAAGVATFTATLSSVSAQTVTVTLGFTGTATNAADYTRSATSITIPAGAAFGAMTVTAVQDGADEADETVIVDITAVTNGAESGVQQRTATITDDDVTPPADDGGSWSWLSLWLLFPAWLRRRAAAA